MSHSQFHSISSLYLDMHGLIFEISSVPRGSPNATPSRCNVSEGCVLEGGVSVSRAAWPACPTRLEPPSRSNGLDATFPWLATSSRLRIQLGTPFRRSSVPTASRGAQPSRPEARPTGPRQTAKSGDFPVTHRENSGFGILDSKLSPTHRQLAASSARRRPSSCSPQASRGEWEASTAPRYNARHAAGHLRFGRLVSNAKLRRRWVQPRHTSARQRAHGSLLSLLATPHRYLRSHMAREDAVQTPPKPCSFAPYVWAFLSIFRARHTPPGWGGVALGTTHNVPIETPPRF